MNYYIIADDNNIGMLIHPILIVSILFLLLFNFSKKSLKSGKNQTKEIRE